MLLTSKLVALLASAILLFALLKPPGNGEGDVITIVTFFVRAGRMNHHSHPPFKVLQALSAIAQDHLSRAPDDGTMIRVLSSA
jgi:hypothetical protein